MRKSVDIFHHHISKAFVAAAVDRRLLLCLMLLLFFWPGKTQQQQQQQLLTVSQKQRHCHCQFTVTVKQISTVTAPSQRSSECFPIFNRSQDINSQISLVESARKRRFEKRVVRYNPILGDESIANLQFLTGNVTLRCLGSSHDWPRSVC